MRQQCLTGTGVGVKGPAQSAAKIDVPCVIDRCNGMLLSSRTKCVRPNKTAIVVKLCHVGVGEAGGPSQLYAWTRIEIDLRSVKASRDDHVAGAIHSDRIGAVDERPVKYLGKTQITIGCKRHNGCVL